VISSAALYNAAKHKGLRGLAHPTCGTSFETSWGKLRRMPTREIRKNKLLITVSKTLGIGRTTFYRYVKAGKRE